MEEALLHLENEEDQEETQMTKREAFLEKLKFNLPDVQSVEVPEWEGRVYVRELNMSDFALMQQAINDKSNSSATYALCVIFCMCDEDGNQLLTLDDFDMLQSQSARAIMKVFGAAAAMNPLMGFDNDESEKKD